MAKRRPSGDSMVRKRDDGRWEGRIVVGHKENGDSIFHYVYAPTQKELSAKLRQHIDSYQGADLTEQSRITLSAWLDQWLENMADMLRPNTLRNYRSYVENHIRPSLGDKQLARITPKDVQRFYDQLGGSLASGTIRRIHTTLHGALKAAQKAHLIASNPTEQIIAPKFSYGAKQILMDEQLDVFMKVIAEDEVWCDFFYTELTTGLRRGEICGLKWEDFDEVSGTLKVCRTVYREDGSGLTAGDTLLQQLGPVDHPVYLLMDRAYEGDKTRALAQELGYVPVVPPKSNRKNPWDYDKQLYKQRNQVERLFRRLKRFRRIFTRYDKLDVIFLAFVYFALIVDALM